MSTSTALPTFEPTREQEAYAESLALDYASVEVRRLDRDEVVSVIARSEDGKATRIDFVHPSGAVLTLAEQREYQGPDRVEGTRLAANAGGAANALDTLRRFAVRTQQAFPQYDGHFDTAGLAVMRRKIRLKSGYLLAGDYLLHLGPFDHDHDADTGVPHLTLFNLRTLTQVVVAARHVRVLVEPGA